MFGKQHILGSDPQPNDMVRLEVRCPFCNKINYIVLGRIKLAQWQAGMNVQDAFPNTSKDDRELLVSGVCKACWDEM